MTAIIRTSQAVAALLSSAVKMGDRQPPSLKVIAVKLGIHIGTAGHHRSQWLRNNPAAFVDYRPYQVRRKRKQ